MKIARCTLFQALCALCMMINSSCGEKKPLSNLFPDSVNVVNSSGHQQMGSSGIFIIPPAGFPKNVDARGVRFGNFVEHEYLLIDTDPGGSPLSVDPSVLKTELVNDVTVLQKINYNGNEAVFFETKSYNIRDAQLRIKVADGKVIRLIAQYREDSDTATINKIRRSMLTVYYSTAKTEASGSHPPRLVLSIDRSRFKLDTAIEQVPGSNGYYYTPGGKKYDGVPPYLWVFESSIFIEGVTGNVKANEQDFPSFREHLLKQGYAVQPVKMPYEINPLNHRVSYFEGVDNTITQPVSLMLYEVKHDQSVIVMIGVVQKGDMTTLKAMKELAASIKVTD